jgi:hypothetical protein
MEDFNINQFKKFDANGLTRVVDKITLTQSNQINFPAAFYKFNELSGKKVAVLYYDNDNKRIAIEFSDDENNKQGFRLNLSRGGDYGAYIAAKAFLSSNKIDLNKYAGRYSYNKQISDEKTFFVIKLSEERRVQ